MYVHGYMKQQLELESIDSEEQCYTHLISKVYLKTIYKYRDLNVYIYGTFFTSLGNQLNQCSL